MIFVIFNKLTNIFHLYFFCFLGKKGAKKEAKKETKKKDAKKGGKGDDPEGMIRVG